ncbi:MAG: hypothetical protein RLZZ230_844 [Candidatus Parcubacteria bacterium]|jgi:peptidoglycan/xylan/chitin deacetylase (PgdA/CDA1 family)
MIAKLRVFYIFVILIVAFYISPLALAANDNLILNPSVENGGNAMPNDWSREKLGNNVSQFNYTRSGNASARSVSINVTKYITGYSGWFFKSVPVVSGKEYIYSEQYKSSVPTKLVLRSFNAAGKSTDIDLIPVAVSDQWKEITTSFTPPANAVSVTVIHRISSLGKVETDNFSLVEITGGATSTLPVPPTPPPTPTLTTTPTTTPTTTGNLIPNPSLEVVSALNVALPASWTKSKFGTNNAKFTYLTTGNTGKRSLKVNITNYTSGVAYYLFAPTTIVGGKTYDYSVRYKADVYAEVDAAFTMADGSVEYQYLGVSYPSANDWSTFKTRIVAPDKAVKVTIYNMLYSVGFLITDDYSLSAITGLPLQKPIVTLTFDDAFTNFYDNAIPLFQKYNMAGTIYLVSQDFENPAYMTPAQLLELEGLGFEMGSHTVTHPHLPLSTPTELKYELEESKRVIEEKLGHTISSFATPYGEYNDTVIPEIMKTYDSHRSVDVGYNSADNYTKSNIKAMSAVVSTSPETVLGWIDTAIANKSWLSIVYHDIVNGGGEYTNTPAHLEAVLAGLKARGVDVMTTRQATNYIDSTLK